MSSSVDSERCGQILEHYMVFGMMGDSDHTKVKGFNTTDAAQLALIDVLERVYIEHNL